MDDKSGEITRLLLELRHGIRLAEDQLFPIVCKHLKRIAANQLRHEGQNHALQPTAPVREACLRLTRLVQIDWQSRSHLFRIAATLMRRILLDHGRAHRAEKQGDEAVQITLDSGMAIAGGSAAGILAVDEASTRPATLDARQAEIIELHFFAGLAFEGIAHRLGISSRTAKRDSAMALPWMQEDLAPLQ